MKVKGLDYTIFTLRNGLKVLLLKRPEKYTVAASLILKAGSIYEAQKTSGVSHFFEHLMFNGTKTFPTEAQFREKELSLGISLSATTGYDNVHISAYFPISEITSSLEFIKEAAFESVLSKSSIERGREVMLSEEGMRRDNPSVEYWDFTMKNRFVNGNPLRIPREGTPTSIRELDQGKIRESYSIHAKQSNAYLVIGSKLEFDKLKRIVFQVFEGLPKGKALSIPDTSKVSTYKVNGIFKDYKQVYLNFNFPYFSSKDLVERWRCGFVIEIIRERLFRRLVLDEGLVHTCFSSIEVLTTSTRLVYIGAICSIYSFEKVVEIIFDEIKKSKNGEIDYKLFEELRKVGNKTIPMNFDSLGGAIEWAWGSFFEQEKVYSPEEVIEARNKVRIEDLEIAAKKLLDFNKLNFIYMGPLEINTVKKTVNKNIYAKPRTY